jgi:hypothetical protein
MVATREHVFVVPDFDVEEDNLPGNPRDLSGFEMCAKCICHECPALFDACGGCCELCGKTLEGLNECEVQADYLAEMAEVQRHWSKEWD